MNKRILLFDDDEGFRYLISQTLMKEEYEIVAFSHPNKWPMYLAEECQCVPSNPCADIIISDIKMPVVDGFCLMESLRKRACSVNNFALISTIYSDEDKEYADRLGCRIFNKTDHIEDIKRWIEECEKKLHPGRVLRDCCSIDTPHLDYDKYS